MAQWVVVLEFLKFPLFLKAFIEPISLLWTPTGSWHETSTLCWGWAVTEHPLIASFHQILCWNSSYNVQPHLSCHLFHLICFISCYFPCSLHSSIRPTTLYFLKTPSSTMGHFQLFRIFLQNFLYNRIYLFVMLAAHFYFPSVECKLPKGRILCFIYWYMLSS